MRITPHPSPLPQARTQTLETARLIARLAATPPPPAPAETVQGRLERLAQDPLALFAALHAPPLPDPLPAARGEARVRARVVTAFLGQARQAYGEAAEAAVRARPRPRANVLRELRDTAPSLAVNVPPTPEPPRPFEPSADDVAAAIAGERPLFPPFSSFREATLWLAGAGLDHGAVPLLALVCMATTALAIWWVI